MLKIHTKKNISAAGIKKTYAETAQIGAQEGKFLKSLQIKIDELEKTVAKLMDDQTTNKRKNVEDSYEPQTKKRDEKRKKGIQQTQGKQFVLNLSSIKLCDDDYILLGKGLKFCPKTNSHDKIKLAEEIFPALRPRL